MMRSSRATPEVVTPCRQVQVNGQGRSTLVTGPFWRGTGRCRGRHRDTLRSETSKPSSAARRGCAAHPKSGSPTPSDVSMRGGGHRSAVDLDGDAARARSNSAENWLGASGPRCRFHEDEHVGPSEPKPPQDEPEQSVGSNDAGTVTVSGKRGQLLPER